VFVIALFNLAILEGLGYAVSVFFPGLIANAEDHLSHLADYARYQEFLRQVYNPITGWENVADRISQYTDCTGRRYPLTTDGNGARMTPIAGAARILFVGDSYTLGREVPDGADYPSRVAEFLDVPVVNYGVDGFGPHQARLLFGEKIALHPEAEIAVLGIMYENIRRVRNSFRAALYVGKSSFQYKPWLDDVGGEVRAFENPNRRPVGSREALEVRAVEVFRADHYAPEPARFPYALRLVRSLARRQTWLRIGEGLEPMYAQYFQDPEFARIIEFAARDFIEAARAEGLEPRVIFIPNNPRDLTSAGPVVRGINADYGEALALNAGEMDIEWERYNLVPYACHPSEYGHAAIARFLARHLSDRLAGFAETGSSHGAPEPGR
jgi:hypothetical protein